VRKLFRGAHQLAVPTYRAIAVVTLYAILALVGSYAFVQVFFALNTSWVAPFIVTPTNDKILDLTEKMVSSQQTLTVLVLDRDRLRDSLGDLKKSKNSLDLLDGKLQMALRLQDTANTVDAPELKQLNIQKNEDMAATLRVLDEAREIETKINKDLRAGLITKGDAAVAKTQLRETRNTYTDGKIAEVLLRESVRQKTPNYGATVDALSKEAELQSSIIQLAIQITAGEEQLRSDETQILQLKAAIATAQNSPYFLATKHDVKFAFVPYENQAKIFEGAGVYSCYLSMVFCRRVGTVQQIFADEEKLNSPFPFFKSELRGSLIQLNLEETEAAKEKVLFVGHKPLLF
jgi:hypothetical protein